MSLIRKAQGLTVVQYMTLDVSNIQSDAGIPGKSWRDASHQATLVCQSSSNTSDVMPQEQDK